MAPYVGPNREQTVKLIRDGKLPIALGRYQPQATISHVDGVYRLRPLVLDDAKCNEFARQRHAAGESFMPEHTWRFLYEGDPLLESPSRDEFIRAIERLDWSY
jgi:hypothetical protein